MLNAGSNGDFQDLEDGEDGEKGEVLEDKAKENGVSDKVGGVEEGKYDDVRKQEKK